MKMKKLCCCVSGLALTLGLYACGNGNNEQQAATPTPAPETQAAAPAAPAAANVIKGKVAEVMDASGYTYLRLDDGSGKEIWAAIPKTDLKVGEEVTLQGGSVMENFSSKTLNRTFESIIFSSGVLREGEEAASSFADAVQGAGQAASGLMSGGSAGNVVPFADLKVEKAAGDNAQTVGDLYAKAKELNGQMVAVRGQVVKISHNIMGKNWIHIQDGTGDPSGNTHDLVVTTADDAAKGDIVTIEGVVAADKDFGSGYRYDVIVEEAKVTKDAAAEAAGETTEGQ